MGHETRGDGEEGGGSKSIQGCKKTSVEHFLAEAKKDAFIIQKICCTVGTGDIGAFSFVIDNFTPSAWEGLQRRH